jgi:hypothetical protein
MSTFAAQNHHKNYKRLIALLLCFWLSGTAGVATYSVFNLYEISSASHKAIDSCTGHNCCHSAKQKIEKSGLSNFSQKKQSATLNCCVLTQFSSLTTAKTTFVDAPALTAKVLSTKLFLPIKKSDFSFSNRYETMPLNRGNTHLRCCVFLI